MNKIALLLCIISLAGGQMFAQTNVSGIISTDATWTLTNSPYVVTGNILVNTGVTLTIEPGVTVKFNSGKSLLVDGTLIARGTSDSIISFTSNTADSAGAWGYIYFSDSSGDAVYENNIYGQYLSGSILEYCSIQYAGGAKVSENGVVRINAGHPFINHCTISHNSATGIIAYNASGSEPGYIKITNSTFSYNVSSDFGGGIAIYGGCGYAVVAGNIMTLNRATTEYGGGIACVSVDTVELFNNIIINNEAYEGGGVGNGGAGFIHDNIIVGNTASTTGGGVFDGGDGRIFDNVIAENSSAGTGGGISTMAYTRSIYGNHIVKNTASDEAAIFGEFNTDIFITSNVIAYNKNTDSSNTLNSSIYFAYHTVDMTYNNIFNNSAFYELLNGLVQGSASINAINNWWGTSDDASIQGKIYDWLDNDSLGVVNYSPYLAAATTSAPISPPNNVTKTDLGSGQVKISWSHNPEADVAGYRVYHGSFNGYSFSNAMDVGSDTSYTLSGVAVADTFAVTAYDSTYSAANESTSTIVNDNMMSGNESWYSYAVDTSTVTGVRTQGNKVPTTYALRQNYPNPFNPATTINYQLPIGNSQLTVLRVYDVLGREVATLVNEVKQPGTYSVQWYATSQPSGVYYYRLVSGTFSETKKLLLLK